MLLKKSKIKIINNNQNKNSLNKKFKIQNYSIFLMLACFLFTSNFITTNCNFFYENIFSIFSKNSHNTSHNKTHNIKNNNKLNKKLKNNRKISNKSNNCKQNKFTLKYLIKHPIISLTAGIAIFSCAYYLIKYAYSLFNNESSNNNNNSSNQNENPTTTVTNPKNPTDSNLNNPDNKTNNNDPLKPIKKTTPKTFEQWQQECAKLPKYAQAADQDYKNCAITQNEFVSTIIELIKTLEKSSLGNQENWIGEQNEMLQHKDFDAKYDFDTRYLKEANTESLKNFFFAQKLDLPENAEISMHADIHADVISLMAYLNELYKNKIIDNNFKIIKDNFYMAFLGDYTDRGCYGAEVLYAIARLKIANPEKVILIRGNHEDLNINSHYGLIEELNTKFPTLGQQYPLYLLQKLYNLMPNAVFVSSKNICNSSYQKNTITEMKNFVKNYAILCHGGPTLGFNPHQLLSDKRACVYQNTEEINQDWLSEDIKKIIKKNGLDIAGQNFCWQDIHSVKGRESFYNHMRAGNKLDNNTILEYLKCCTKVNISKQDGQTGHKVNFIFRGHQHNGNTLKYMINNYGIYNMLAPEQWDGKSKEINLNKDFPVWTLNVCPDSVYGQHEHYNFDNYTVLKLNGSPRTWSLEPHNVIV